MFSFIREKYCIRSIKCKTNEQKQAKNTKKRIHLCIKNKINKYNTPKTDRIAVVCSIHSHSVSFYIYLYNLFLYGHSSLLRFSNTFFVHFVSRSPIKWEKCCRCAVCCGWSSAGCWSIDRFITLFFFVSISFCLWQLTMALVFSLCAEPTLKITRITHNKQTLQLMPQRMNEQSKKTKCISRTNINRTKYTQLQATDDRQSKLLENLYK